MAFKPDPKIKNEVKEQWQGSQSTGYRQSRIKGFRSKSKFNNVTTEYGGIKYDSKLEAKIAQDLDWKLKAKEIKSWKRQVKIPLRVNGVLICNYYVDFFYIDKNDTHVYAEAKGMELPLWQLKWKLFTALINEIDMGAELIVLKA